MCFPIETKLDMGVSIGGIRLKYGCVELGSGWYMGSFNAVVVGKP